MFVKNVLHVIYIFLFSITASFYVKASVRFLWWWKWLDWMKIDGFSPLVTDVTQFYVGNFPIAHYYMFFFHDWENCCVQYFTLHLYNFKYRTLTDVPFCDTQILTQQKHRKLCHQRTTLLTRTSTTKQLMQRGWLSLDTQNLIRTLKKQCRRSELSNKLDIPAV